MPPSFPGANANPRCYVTAISITRCEGETVAHALAFDIVATGPDESTARRRLDSLVEAYIRCTLDHGSWKDLDTPAPRDYWVNPVDSRPELLSNP